jgi:hypothetical protein
MAVRGLFKGGSSPGMPMTLLLSLLTLLLALPALHSSGGGRVAVAAAAVANSSSSHRGIEVSSIDDFLAALEDESVFEVLLTGKLLIVWACLAACSAHALQLLKLCRRRSFGSGPRPEYAAHFLRARYNYCWPW